MADKAIFLRLVPSVSLQSTYLPYERDRKINLILPQGNKKSELKSE